MLIKNLCFKAIFIFLLLITVTANAQSDCKCSVYDDLVKVGNSKVEIYKEVIKVNGKGLNTTVKENNEHISRASQIIKDRKYLLNIKLKTKAGFRIDNAEEGGVNVKIHLLLLY